MKGFAFVLLCALVAVQGRNTGLQSTRSVAALGENPWVVHLRIAVSSSGLLETCGGTLINPRWVLTAASCTADSRFIWIRYATLNVINPLLVTESSSYSNYELYNPTTGRHNIGLISVGRTVQITDYINFIFPQGEVGESGKFCGFSKDNSAPGEELNCYEVELTEEKGKLIANSDKFVASKFDLGASVVSNGRAVGILVRAGAEGSVGEFLATTKYASWIRGETGFDVAPPPQSVPEVAPEAVHFV